MRKAHVARKQVGLLAVAVPLALSQAACSLSSRSTNRLVISMPEGGFAAQTSLVGQRDSALLGHLGLPSSAATSVSGGGSEFPAPSSLSDFKCIGVMVSGPGIAQDPLFDDACKPNPAPGVAPNGLGQIVGLVSASGGTIDVQVQGGPNRLIQLIGVQADGDCPSLAQAMSEDHRAAAGIRLGEPYEIARVQQDIFADQTIEMKAAFDPSIAEPVFSCHGEGGDGGVGTGAIVFSELDLYPHTPSSSGHLRVIGKVTGHPKIDLFKDPACTDGIQMGQWNHGPGGLFSVEGGYLSASTPVYIQGENASGVGPCVPVGNYVYIDSTYPQVRINDPFSGKLLTQGMMTPVISGSCGPAYNAQVEIFIGATSYGSCSCNSGTPGSFACTLATIAAVPDGPFVLRAVVTRSGDLVQTDDAVFLVKDSLAPDLEITNPANGAIFVGGGLASVAVGGSCSELGSPVRVGYWEDGVGFQELANAPCTASVWSTVVDLTPVSLPDGQVFLEARHATLNAPVHETYRVVSVYKYAVAPTPTVTAISPGTGYTSGSDFVTIWGNDFIAGATVDIGGGACNGVNVISSSQLTCNTPARSIGTYLVTVVNPGNVVSTGSVVFSYVDPPPYVGSVTPSNGTYMGGTAVTINGSFFVAGATVDIGGVSCGGVTVVNPNLITCTTQAGTPGTYPVIVTNPGNVQSNNTFTFTYDP